MPANRGGASIPINAFGAAAAISPRSGSIRKTPTASMSRTPRAIARMTPVSRSPAFAARPAATIITPSGSTRTIRTLSCWPRIKGRSSPSTAVKPTAVWYNQPTAQFYHVATDNRFPYWVYGGQQESGSAGVASRGRDGQITFRDWHPVGVEEYGYVAPDPLDPDIIYGGKISRFDGRTGQVQHIAPEALRGGKYRFLRTAPVIFSPVDPKALYFAGNVLFKTTTGGQTWSVISPDLSREKPGVPESIGVFRSPSLTTMSRRGVIYTVAPSYKDAATIWCGTDDGLIHVTRDGGKKWTNVTPPALTAWSKVSLIDAGRHDANTAYAAINRIRLDDMKPHIWRTHDGGKTWTEIVRGLSERSGQRCARGSRPAGVAVLRHRAGRFRVVQRRRRLATVANEYALFIYSRFGDSWRRPGRRHARPIVLDPRRHLAVAAIDAAGGGVARSLICAGRSHAGSME